MYRLFCFVTICTGLISCDEDVYNTTAAATNIESTLGTPVILVDPTSITTQNSTDTTFEPILRVTLLSNSTNESVVAAVATASTTSFDGDIDLAALIERIQRNTSQQLIGNDNEKYDEFSQSRQAIAKQISNPFGFLAGRSPCECHNGVCGCCTGMLFSALRQLGCLNITYDPENFAFEFEMLMNNAVLYKNRVTGRNPPPVCARMPGISFIRLCASFYDLYFVGRNMHVCLEMSAFFQDSEILNRSFDCIRVGDKGVKIVRPEDGSDLFHKPGTDAEVDAGFDDVEDYDENAVVRRRKFIAL